MKTLDYVIEHHDEIEQDKFFDTRWTTRLLEFLPAEYIEKYGYTYGGTDINERKVKEWTEENVLAQLKEDVEFAIEKATNHRGISSGLMNDVLRSWCIVLENGLEDTDYGFYGDKLIKKIDKYYNFNLVDDNTFDEDFYREW